MYPEVRRLWLGWIDRLLEAGVDRINIRVSAHGTLTNDSEAYGYNAPVLEEYARGGGSGTPKLPRRLRSCAASTTPASCAR